MKKFIKITLLVSLCCALCGVIFFGIGAVTGNGFSQVEQLLQSGELHFGPWYVNQYSVTYGKEKGATINEQYNSEEIQNLNVDLKYGELYITKSSDVSTVSVEASGDTSEFSVKQDGTTLVIEDQRTDTNLHDDSLSVTIYLPKDKEFQSVDIQSNAGSINLDSKLLADEMNLQIDGGTLYASNLTINGTITVTVGAGEVDMDQLTAENLTADIGAGELSIDTAVLKNLSANCGIGTMEMYLTDASEDDYNYNISCGLGEVVLDDETYSALSNQKVISNGSNQNISIECGVGDVELTFGE